MTERDYILESRKKEDSFCELCYFFRNYEYLVGERLPILLEPEAPCFGSRGRYVDKNDCGWAVIDGVSVNITDRDIKFYDETDKTVCYQRNGESALRNLMQAINRVKVAGKANERNYDGSSDGFVRREN